MTAATEWHDRRPAGWPSQKPVGLITAFLLALLTIPAMLAWQDREEWTALQRLRGGWEFQAQELILIHEAVHAFGKKDDALFGGSKNLSRLIIDNCDPIARPNLGNLYK